MAIVATESDEHNPQLDTCSDVLGSWFFAVVLMRNVWNRLVARISKGSEAVRCVVECLGIGLAFRRDVSEKEVVEERLRMLPKRLPDLAGARDSIHKHAGRHEPPDVKFAVDCYGRSPIWKQRPSYPLEQSARNTMWLVADRIVLGFIRCGCRSHLRKYTVW